jgi:hypothetical protein
MRKTYVLTIETSNPEIDEADLDTAIRAAVFSMSENIDEMGEHDLRIEASVNGIIMTSHDYTATPLPMDGPGIDAALTSADEMRFERRLLNEGR